MGNSSTLHGQPTQLNGSTNGSLGTSTNLQQDHSPSLLGSVEHAPVQHPMNNDPLGDPFLGNMPTMAATNGALSGLTGPEVTSGLLSQFESLIPPPAAGAVPINNASDTASPSGTAELGEQKKWKEEEEEDWLIQF